MSPTSPRVTVVVCVYNRAKQIGACLESIAAQVVEGLEIVVVDDGSTDETPELLRQFAAAHSEVVLRICTNPHNLGLSAARNVGIRAAAGEFVAFTDSDCVAEPGWLAALIEAFQTPETVAVAGLAIDHPPRNLAELAYHGTTRIVHQGIQRRRLVGNNMAFRREVLQRFPFDEALRYYCDEDELAWRLEQAGWRFAFAPRAVVRHDHPLTFGKYLRLAYRQAQGSARYWYKRGTYVGRDLWPLLAALITLPLGLVHPALLALPAACLLLQLAAMLYNEVAFKGKSLFQAVSVLPLLMVYYVVRATGVALTWLRVVLGQEQAIRESKRAWLASRPCTP